MPAILEVSPSAEAVRTQVDRILQSTPFRASGVLRHLLAYLVEKCLTGEGDSLKEYTIGIDALGKPESFDPRHESVVRMHTARLRQKLADYYRTDGAEDTLVLDLPKGGFKITFEQKQAPPAEPAIPVAAPVVQSRSRWSRLEMGLAAGLIAVLSAGALAFLPHRSAPDPLAGFTPDLKELWGPLISSNRRLVVCIATPLFVEVPGFGSIRHSALNDWDNVLGDKGLASVEKALDVGMSAPSFDYTEVGTATGAFQLGQFLAPVRQNVLIKRANLLSWPDIADDNVIFLGPPGGIHQTGDIPIDAQMVLEDKGVRNLHPKAGEPDFLADAPGRDGEESGLSHALISRIPAMNGNGAILMLSGNQTASVMASVQALTDPALARALVAKLRSASGKMPRYFQIALNVKSMDDVPVEITYPVTRELSEAGKPAARK
ncbi:MAG TPA: hypothetical protein VG273_07110 [Bryobacteraceae bacterium]|jgi:hypothetical protein|nr:hypothetical protein [Bryobacteraceae bacterium]